MPKGLSLAGPESKQSKPYGTPLSSEIRLLRCRSLDFLDLPSKSMILFPCEAEILT